jgi:putative acetyltransferase
VGFARIDSEGLIDLLYVHPDFQRQGVARELFSEICSWAERRGIRHLRSEVSETARPFFESVGFWVVKAQVVERQGVSLSNFLMERLVDAEHLR